MNSDTELQKYEKIRNTIVEEIASEVCGEIGICATSIVEREAVEQVVDSLIEHPNLLKELQKAASHLDNYRSSQR
jgi:hypothetical protein